MFRFTLDAAQSNCRAGWATRTGELRWRKAAASSPTGRSVRLGEQAAGFVAEFCALGGRVVDAHLGSVRHGPGGRSGEEFPRDVDGVYLAQAILPMSAFLKRYAALGHDLADHVVASAEVVGPIQERCPPRWDSWSAVAPPWSPPPRERAYARRFARAFPSMAAPAISGGSLAYGVGVEAALHALAPAARDEREGRSSRRSRRCGSIPGPGASTSTATGRRSARAT